MDPYSILSLFLKATGYFFLGLVLLFCYKFIIVPLLKLRFYKKQGLSSYFFPLLGFIKRDKQYEKATGDFMGYYKQLPEAKPDLRAIVDSFASRVDVLLFDPKLIKEFFHNQHLYKKHQTAKIMKALAATGLVIAEGDMWKKHRKVVSSVFHYEFLRESVPSIINATRDFLEKIQQTSLKKVDILSQAQTITSGIIGKLFFSENLNQYSLKGKSLPLFLVDILFDAIAIFRKPLPIIMIVTGCKMERLASYRQLMTDITEFREVCCRIVRERKQSNLTRTGPKSHDLLEFLLDAQNAANVEDQFTDEEIVDEFITFFLGGMDSTAHLVSMTLYLLSVYPEYLKKVQEEINEHCGQDVYDIGTINRLEFLHSVLKETLRMYAPAPGMTSRQAQEDHTLLDLKIKKGDFVKPTPYYNYFNEKYFEEPKVFKPERWLNKKESNLDPFVFIPFSAGPRNCIGQHLAILETKVIVAEFVKKFKFRSQENYELKMTLGSLYEPKEKVLLDLELV